MVQAESTKTRGSDTVTDGIRVSVHPRHLAEKSDPDARKWVFAYRIRIANEGQRAVQLLSRHWTIVDATGERQEVQGDGVIGQQPRIGPGQAFEYESFCPLPTRWGTMDGTYLMERDDGEQFRVGIARFYLVAP